MKFLSVIAASLAAFAAAQPQRTSFRGGSKGQSAQQKGGNRHKPNGSGSSRWSQQKNNKKKCSAAKIPKTMQDKFTGQFNALDVDHSGSLDSSEFKEAAAKIEDAFQNSRNGKKPSWYHKGSGSSGRPGRGSGSGRPGRPGRGSGSGSGRPGRGSGSGRPGRPGRGSGSGSGRFGRGDHGGRKNGGRSLADEPGNDFWTYLQSKGFVTPKPKNPKNQQKMKDRIEAARAARVFSKFDKDHNRTISLCEYETAMYRTQMFEKNQANNVVVVHG